MIPTYLLVGMHYVFNSINTLKYNRANIFNKSYRLINLSINVFRIVAQC